MIRDEEADPKTYLRFSEEDLAGPDCPRRRVNALSNAKRALHLQIEVLTDALGYPALRRQQKGFPDRLAFAQECGIIAPIILTKVNKLRNQVEHEYVVPDREVVADYADVVRLYLGASDQLVRSFPHLRELYVPDTDGDTKYCLRIRRESGRLRLYKCRLADLLTALPDDKSEPRLDPDEREPVGIAPVLEVDIGESAHDYFTWLRVLIGADQ